jgi:hypothetical protein
MSNLPVKQCSYNVASVLLGSLLAVGCGDDGPPQGDSTSTETVGDGDGDTGDGDGDGDGISTGSMQVNPQCNLEYGVFEPDVAASPTPVLLAHGFMRSIDAPARGAIAEPGQCNTNNNFLPTYDELPGAPVIRIVDAQHFDFETDACGGGDLGCGPAHRPARRPVRSRSAWPLQAFCSRLAPIWAAQRGGNLAVASSTCSYSKGRFC